MTTKEELIEAWETIARFCDKQQCCDFCPLENTCFDMLESGVLSYVSSGFIEKIEAEL